MKRLQSGVYDDGQGGLHIDVGEILADAGIDDTPENRAAIIAAAHDMAEEMGLPVEERP